MKKVIIHKKTTKALVIAIAVLLSFLPLRATNYAITLSCIEAFSTSGNIQVASSGGEVEIVFSYSSGGPMKEILEADILMAVEMAGCSDIITDATVTYTYMTYNGKLMLSVATNDEGYREIAISASSGSVTLKQAVAASAVYSLTRVNPSSGAIFHGQTINFRLSGSDDFATYQLCRTVGTSTTCGIPVPGTGGTLSFKDTRAGTYTALSDYPSPVDMNGSVTVSYLAFYGYAHMFSQSSYTLDADGGTITVPFSPNSTSSLPQLNTILSAYSNGESAEWDDTVQISYGSNNLTLTWGPNLGAAIHNCTYFVRSGSDTLTFNVPSGGALLQQDYTLVNGVITLASSQYLVTYELLSPGGTVVSTQTGTGSALSFTVPSSPAGTWRIRASYKGQSLLLRAGIAVTSTGEVLDGGENWILRRTLRDSLGTSVMRDITYYDGLGYPVQAIQADASPTGGSLVTPVYYDNVRRDDARTYLPFVSSTGLSKVSSPFTAQQTWYAGQYNASEGAAAYAVRVYEPSALNRVTATRRPGSTYASGSHDAEVSYSTNAAGSVWKVKEGATSATLTVSGYYPAGSLHCVTAVDEDGITVQTFTDNMGRTVLERRNLPSSQTADTYYVYDGAGRVTWVVTPEGSALLTNSTSWTIDATNAAAYCYRYTYDGLGRMTERRQPGRTVEYFVYDPAGRLVARQDGNLSTAGKWVLSKYNPFGEEVRQYLTGSNVFSFSGLKNAFASSANPAGVYTQVSNILLLERSYDTRPAGAPAFAEPANSIVAHGDTATINGGRLLYEKLADLPMIASGTVQYVQRSYYYDKRGRLRQQVETGPLNGTLRTSLRYDYVGSEDRRSVSGTLGEATSTLDRTASFDSRSRLLRESAILGMKTAAVRHGYDVLGRHKCDTLTATGAAGIVTDTYDIRSQLLTRTAKKSSTTLFEETLRYDSPTRGTAARYAGGLSEVMTLQGSTRNTYGFIYDAAGRLMTTTRFTGTNGTSGSAAYTERNLTYNRNGALLTLKRYGSGTSTAQDDYSYTYSGPLLTGVSGKDDGSNINASFSHDGNGNTTADGRANLTFTYNLLNLPETVTSGNTQTATYHWLSDGTKYKVTDPAGNGVIYAGDLTYAVTVSGGNTTYALESAEASADGTARFLKNGTAMTPYYTIRDHIGSVRTIVNASGTVVERNDYYPFGSRTTFGASYATLSSNRQKFSGKEDQTTVVGSTLPYLDFGARMYDAKLVRWNTYDPMAEKYYGINPYVYCAGDPVNLVDPKGNDIWEVNKQGEVVTRKPDSKKDAFFIVSKDADGQYHRVQTTDDNGNTTDVSICFEKGTIKENNQTIRTINSKGDIKSKQLSLFEVKGDDNATQLFEFMANPFEATTVEWTHAKIGTEVSGRNIVGTSHNESSTVIGHYLRQTGYTLREVNHNHPDGDGRPSKGDKEGAREYHKNNSNTLLNVYIHPGHYIRYNQYGEIIR